MKGGGKVRRMRKCALGDCDRPIGGGTAVAVKVGPIHVRVVLCEQHWRAVNDASSDDAMRVSFD